MLKLSLRLSVIAALAALLAACSSTPPSPPVAVAPSLPAPSASAAQDVLFNAMAQVGTPYRYGGSSPQSGFDCSGLIQYVYRGTANVHLPRTTLEMSQLNKPAVSRGELAAGDLLFFNISGRISHAGIYVGEGRFVHAPSSGGYVRLDRLADRYWTKHYAGAKRIIY
ncbi:C40 family peptidase [Atopomonas sediminilitoris]|uniref:C40 family peptidase n=1 Tax=Atopomonas sediminilitoris TaxID=2919919 RepID=UPI001F4D5AFD|nr:C40 family peptidase [Atopomonas sediminilitoris]MCJ8168552.1 C40 family peptidase [Atopomonas sediminilitoris]